MIHESTCAEGAIAPASCLLLAVAVLSTACSGGEAAGIPGAVPSVDAAGAEASTIGDGSGDVARDDGSEPEVSSALEACNFLDDDGDGEVDEGFAWRRGAWRHLVSTTRFAQLGAVLPLGHDAFAAAAFDQYGEPHDKAFVGRWASDGTLQAGPTWVDFPFVSEEPPRYCAGGVPSLSRLGEDGLLLLFGSTDWGGCVGGCPVTATVLSAADASLLQSGSWSIPFLRGDEALSLACVSAEQCLVLATGGGLAHPAVMSIAPMSGAVSWTLPLERAGAAWLALDGGRAFVLQSVSDPDAGTQALYLLTVGLDGKTLGEPRLVGPAPGSSRLGLRHLGDAAFVEVGVLDSPSASRALAAIPDDVSLPIMQTSLLSPEGITGLVRIGDTLVLEEATGSSGLQIRRLRRDLSPVPAPRNPLLLEGAYASAVQLAWTGSRLVHVQSNYDGRSVDMVELECAP